MRRTLLIACVLGCTLFAKAKDWTQYVNPLMGSQSTFELSTGNTYPAIAHPWGMNFWTPQTGKMGDGWQYTYTANKIRGFKQTHQPSPWINDYGQFSIMPIVGKPVFDEEKRASWFAHKGETATPYYYKVYLAEHDIVTEMAPTERAVLFRFTFPENDHSYIVIDAFDKGSYIKVIPEENKVIGYTTRNSGGVPENFKNYFIIEFDKPFTYKATVANGNLQENVAEQTADHAGAIIGFRTHKGEQVHARISSSFISFEQAATNMKELSKDNMEQLAKKGKDAWNQVLGKIEVEGGNLDQYRTFYSCLYRSLLFPRKFYELDATGKPIHYSPYNGQVLPGYMYTDTGFWDTFRCLFPLLNLMYPSINKEMQEGLINTYKESGFFPEWASPGHRGCMVGNNSASVLVDAYMKGVRVDDIKTLYEGLLHGTENVHPQVSSTGRLGHEYYNKLGYVPYDVKINENAARTLEYAYDDWTIYQTALKAGNKEIADTYRKRALNYRNIYDTSIGFARPRYSDGTFKKEFDVLQTYGEGFIEGNSWNFSFHVPHDVFGMIDLMGGEKTFVQKLDELFSMHLPEKYYEHNEDITEECLVGGYVHGNEPSHHVPYLYAWTSQPWKTQYWLREILNKMYKNDINGLGGNDDCGQMSAWYLFSVMGFYPVCPGTDQYVLGAPYLPYLKLTLPNGKTLEIKAPGVSDKKRYVQSLKLNGESYDKMYITHEDILKGGVLEFKMSASPNKRRGVSVQDKPYSLTNGIN